MDFSQRFRVRALSDHLKGESKIPLNFLEVPPSLGLRTNNEIFQLLKDKNVSIPDILHETPISRVSKGVWMAFTVGVGVTCLKVGGQVFLTSTWEGFKNYQLAAEKLVRDNHKGEANLPVLFQPYSDFIANYPKEPNVLGKTLKASTDPLLTSSETIEQPSPKRLKTTGLGPDLGEIRKKNQTWLLV